MNTIFEEMVKVWPSAIVARTEIYSFTGGLMSEKYIANLDSQGNGPANRFRVGRKIAYPVIDVVKWLESRGSKIKKGPKEYVKKVGALC